MNTNVTQQPTDSDVTQKAVPVKQLPEWKQSSMDAPIPPSLVDVQVPSSLATRSIVPKKKVSRTRSRSGWNSRVKQAYMVREQCRQLYLSVFFREQASVRSLGFTSAIGGEGKSFVALITASGLANDSDDPVILLECNWEHPYLHDYFGLPSVPGLAEWLREECSDSAIRHQISHNLTVIPAGNGKQDAVKLLQQARRKGLVNMLARANERLIVDLPAIMTVGYGRLAASLVESLLVVVHAGVTQDALIADTLKRIEALPVEGVILNQLESRIPGWIRQIL